MRNTSILLLFILCVIFCTGCNVNKNTQNNKEDLQIKTEKIKYGMIGSVFPKLLFASDNIAVIMDDNGIIIYSLEDQKISDIILFKDNEVMGDIYLQGDEARSINVDVEGSQIYIHSLFQSLFNGKNYCYDLKTKDLKELSDITIDEIDKFDNYADIQEFQFLPGKDENYYVSEEQGIQIGKNDFLYLINTNFKSIEGLALVRCKDKELIEIPIWN